MSESVEQIIDYTSTELKWGLIFLDLVLYY